MAVLRLVLLVLTPLLIVNIFWNVLQWILYALLILLSCVAGLMSAILVYGRKDLLFSTLSFENSTSSTKKLLESEMNCKEQRHRIVTTVNLDAAIEELMDLVIRDYVLSWYKLVGSDTKLYSSTVKRELWAVIESFNAKIKHINRATFLSQNCVTAVTEHLEAIQLAHQRNYYGNRSGSFVLLHSCLRDETTELNYLRFVAEVFLIFLAPKPFVELSASRFLLREILACKVFKPAIDLITDPFYLNSKLYNWLVYREQLQIRHRPNFAYSSNFDECMSFIRRCTDLERLKQMRLDIISEIMLSTAIKNIKRSRGIGADKSLLPESMERGELLYSRNLPKYIGKLRVAKSACEKRIHLLGGAEYLSYVEESQLQEKIPGQRILSFLVIMQSEEARSHFATFLKKSSKDCLIRYWEAVEEMKKANRVEQYRVANRIYESFLSQKSSLLLQILNSAIFISLKAYLVGDEGPEGFWESQSVVYNFMEEKFYGSFIASDIYHQHVTELSDFWISSDILDTLNQPSDEMKCDSTTEQDSESSYIALHSTYAREKLEALGNKIQNKSDALAALQELQKNDLQTLKLMDDMTKDLESITDERKQLEYHAEQTGVWMHHLGKWKAYICSADVIPTGNRDTAVFLIVVNLIGKSKRATFLEGASLEGALSDASGSAWIISRKLEDFEELLKQLIQIHPLIAVYRIPSRLNLQRSESLEKARHELQLFLNHVLEDEVLAQCEPVFAFFSKSLEFLKQSSSDQELKNSKTVFSASAILKRMAVSLDRFSRSRARLPREAAAAVGDVDTSVQPLYDLIASVFELTSLSNWLRRTLVALVQVTFGKSITRKIQETVEWIVSEPMLIYYLHLFRDAYWPGGRPADQVAQPSEEEKLKMKALARKKLLDSIPGAAKNLFGDDKARAGAMKVFHAFQDSRLNKHIFYRVLDLFLEEAFVRRKRYV